MKRVLKRLQENLGSKLRPATAARDEIDGLVKIGSAVSNPLGKRQRIPGLDKDVQAPTLDLFAVVLLGFESLHFIHPAMFAFFQTFPAEES